MRYLLALITLLNFLTQENSLAQHNEVGLPFIVNFSPAEYSANTQNWAIVQSQEGLMYFGNNKGVLEYDGTNWRLIPLSNQSIARSLATDEHGRIYVGGVGDFGYLTPDSLGRLIYHSLAGLIPAQENNFSDVWSTVIYNDAVYFQSYTRLFRYKDNKIKSWPIINSYHRTFVVHGRLYLRQDGIGLTTLKDDSLVLAPKGEEFTDMVVSAMLPLGSNILIGSRHQGLFVYNPESGELKPYQSAANAYLADKQLYHGIQLTDGRLAFATLENGLCILEADGRISINLTRDTGLPYNTIYYLFSDCNNHLWTGSAHGISRIEVSSPFSVFDELLGLDGAVLAMTRHKGKLYVSTHQGLYTLNRHSHFEKIEGISTQSWQITEFTNPENKQDTHLLVASIGGVYQLIDNKTQLILSGRAAAISNSISDKNRVFVGFNSQIASLRYNGTEFKQEAILDFFQAEIRSIQEDFQGNIWVSTIYNGIYKIPTKAWEAYVANPDYNVLSKTKHYTTIQGLPTTNWNYLHIVADRMLVTTQKGIYQYNKASDRFVPEPVLTKAQKGEDRWFYYLKEDKQGNLWFDSDKGKGQFIPTGSGYRLSENMWKRIIVAPENQVAGYAEQDGTKWFGTPDGLFRFNPKSQNAIGYQFTTHIRKVTIGKDSVIYFGARQQKKNDNSVLYASLTHADLKAIEYKHNQVTFQYSSTAFESKNNTLYSYKLEGFDEEWSDWVTLTQKEYTNLPAGNYTFKVKGKNYYGITSPAQSYDFTIAAPWYQTLWAYSGFGLLFIGIVAGAARVNSLRLKQRNIELEAVVAIRTQELESQKTALINQKNELEVSYKNVTTLSKIGQQITATLNLQHIIDAMYNSTKSLIRFDSFGIGLYNEHTNTLDFIHAYENGEELPPFSINLKDKNQLATWCFSYGKEVIIGDFKLDTKNYLKKIPTTPVAGGKNNESIIYVPLIVKKKVIGVISVQSLKKKAYRSYQVDILRTLAAYSAIALDNSYAYLQLNEINEELNSTLENLKQTQGQLVQSEKMASLGQLTAGVAHEINNPINFVSAGIDSLLINYNELNELLALYKRLQLNGDNSQLLQEIEQLKEELDLGCLLLEIPELLNSIKTGAKRTTEIVKSLRNFARLDEENLKKANLEEGIESTLVILRNKFKDRIKVEKQFCGLPEMLCFPGQINQVFMNLINNAIQAMPDEGILSIGTQLEQNTAILTFSDTGVGMSPEVAGRIFEPFYTTKEVGEGTGLGLSIAYGIIEKHKGTIHVDSEVGKGTCFTIKLPLPTDKI